VRIIIGDTAIHSSFSEYTLQVPYVAADEKPKPTILSHDCESHTAAYASTIHC